MSISWELGTFANALSGLLLMVMGAYVGSVKPRRPANTAFAAFGMLYGLRFFAVNSANIVGGDPLWLQLPLVVLAIAGGFGAAIAMPFLAVRFPRDIPVGQRRQLLLPAAIAVVGGGTAILAAVLLQQRPFVVLRELPPAYDVLARLEFLGNQAALAAVLFLVGVLAIRFRASDTPAGERRQLALTAAAVGIYPGFILGTVLFVFAPAIRVSPFAGLAMILAVCALWLRNTRAGGAGDRALARNVALFLLAWPLVGMTAAAFLGTQAGTTSGIPGATRVLGEAVLAYAILKHQLLGIDVKVRWTIQKSTIAAAFIGVFFVVSEGAQHLFSQSLGPLVGILGAGALVFALAPLQRAAERLAETAVPVAAKVEPAQRGRARGDPRDVYRAAVRYALTDRVVSHAEERHLAQVAEHLGIGAAEALALREEVGRELAGTKGRGASSKSSSPRRGMARP